MIVINDAPSFPCDEYLAPLCLIKKDLLMGEPRNLVVQLRGFGSPDELEVVETPLPIAGRGEVRIRVLASGLEYTDVTNSAPPLPANIRPPATIRDGL